MTRSFTPHSAAGTLRGVLFDIDGVLEYQGRTCPGAVEAVQALQEQAVALRFVTNSTLKSRASCADQLRRHGFQVADEQVFTASYLTAEYLRRSAVDSCWVMLDGDGLSEFREFRQDHEHPQCVVVGDSRSNYNADQLNRALRALLRGSRLIGMQPELLDTSKGELELNVGSWVGMLERASGLQATYIGKPNAFAFEIPLESMRLPKEQVIVVGDQLSTDILGAQRLGLRTLFVRAGEFRQTDGVENVRPDFTVENMHEALAVLSALGKNQHRSP